jgi:hypothetical protein
MTSHFDFSADPQILIRTALDAVADESLQDAAKLLDMACRAAHRGCHYSDLRIASEIKDNLVSLVHGSIEA